MRTIPVNTPLPPELHLMMEDFRSMTNHLISYALHHRLTSAFTIRDQNYGWFRKNYGGRYAIHYLHSASSFAAQHVRSWRRLGGVTTSLPHVERPIARLDQMLVKVKSLEAGRIRLQVTLAPRQWVLLDLPVHHKHFAEWSTSKLGELVIVPEGVRLSFQAETPRLPSKGSVGVDLNFDRAVMATSSGEIKEVSLKEVVRIQHAHRKKRISVQRHLPNNPAKQAGILERSGGRERNRIRHRLYAAAKALGALAGAAPITLEDLSSTTQECVEDASGREFRAKLSSWPHGMLQEILRYRHPYGTKEVYARGTSTWCPFCGSILTHPVWSESRCEECGAIYDRDALAGVSIEVRGLRPHRKGEKWALARDVLPRSTSAKLKEQCKLQEINKEETPGGLGSAVEGPPLTLEHHEVPGEESDLRGISPAVMLGSVGPESAVRCEGELSDTDRGQMAGVVQENRDEAFVQRGQRRSLARRKAKSWR